MSKNIDKSLRFVKGVWKMVDGDWFLKLPNGKYFSVNSLRYLEND